jgi:1-acyl-sn-glycerol-3-phosphate acyltransferase
MIPVTRGRGAARMADDACAALDAGQAVLVYPEGTIVPPGQTRPARPGAGLVALRISVPVLPIASRGVKRRRPRLRPQVTVVIALRGPVVLPWPAGPTSPLDVSTALLTSVQTLHHNP